MTTAERMIQHIRLREKLHGEVNWVRVRPDRVTYTYADGEYGSILFPSANSTRGVSKLYLWTISTELQTAFPEARHDARH